LNWKKNNGNRVPNNEEMIEISGKSKQMMLELNKANAAKFQASGADAAWWQEVTATMFQFGQVSTKTIELLGASGDKLSPGMKGRMALAQVGLFGTAGIPLITAMWLGVAHLFGVEEEEISDEVKTAANNGMTQALFTYVFKADVEVGSRASLAPNVSGLILDMIDGSSGLQWETFNAAGSMLSKAWDLVAKGIMPVLDAAIHTDEVFTSEDALIISKYVAGLTSTTRSFLEAYMMRNYHMLADPSGTVIAAPEGRFNTQTEVFTLLGLSPSVKQRTFENNANADDITNTITGFTDLYEEIYYQSAILNEGIVSKRGIQKLDRMLVRLVPTALHAQVRANFRARLEDPKTKSQKALAKWLSVQVVDPITGLLVPAVPTSTLRNLGSLTPAPIGLGQQKDLRDN
jgi:hypothetical protein